jgi:hypothetical protein
LEKEDARYQTLEQLHERRKQVVRLHKKGIKVMQMVAMTGLSYPTVRSTIDLFEAGGWTKVRPTRRGRIRGDGRVRAKPRCCAGLARRGIPAIEQRARAERGKIHWGDETALVNTDVRGSRYAPAGKTPVAMAVGGTRQKLSMISTVTNQCKARWMMIDEGGCTEFCVNGAAISPWSSCLRTEW